MLGSDLPVIDLRTNDESNLTTILRDRLLSDLEEGGEAPVEKSVEAVAQAYEDAKDFGSNALQAAAERILQSADLAPSASHHLLAALPFSLIVTTAQDYHLEAALRAATFARNK
jgi:hypothetical protein